MGLLLDSASKVLGIPAEVLETEAVRVWATQKLCDVTRTIAEIAENYDAQSPDDIEAKIKQGVLEGHPAWEDAIRWENLGEFKENLLKFLAEKGIRV